MDHAEARELLEIAAADPGGFERLIAGDTIDAAALAGHVTGQRRCVDRVAGNEPLEAAGVGRGDLEELASLSVVHVTPSSIRLVADADRQGSLPRARPELVCERLAHPQ